jgi:hypothetical protein
MSVALEKSRAMAMLEELDRNIKRSRAITQRESGPLVEMARLVVGREDRYQMIFEPKGLFSAETHMDAEGPTRREHPQARERIVNADCATTQAGLPSTKEEQKYCGYADDTMDSYHGGIADEVLRARRPLYLFAATIIVIAGLAGLTANLISWTGAPNPSETAMTKTETELVKLPAETTTSADVPTQNVRLVGPSTQSSTLALVNNAEQTVDATRAHEKAPSTVSLREDSGFATEAAAVPAPPAQAQKQAEPHGIAAPAEPEKIWAVTIRPDGTLLSNDAPPPTVAPSATSALAAAPPASRPDMATRVNAAPEPAAPAKLGDQSQSQNTPIAHKPKARAAATVRKAKPAPIADAQAKTRARQSTPAPASDGPLAFIQRAVDSFTGAVNNSGRIDTGSRP